MKVRNSSCIRHLSAKTLKASGKRNLMAIIAIVLTTLLFTSLFTVVLSINESLQDYQFRSGVGSKAHGAFKNVDEEMVEKLSAHRDIKAYGLRTVIGITQSGALEKDYSEVSWMSDNTAAWSFCTPTTGRMPQSGKEIAMDTKALAILGVEPEIGAPVSLTYTITDKNQLGREITDTFTLCGWWDYDEVMSVHSLNVSKEYAEEIERLAMEDDMMSFRTDMSVMLKNSLDIESALTKIGEDCGYQVGDKIGQLRIGVNWGYTSTQILDSLDAGGILAIASLLLLVAFTGYLVIYNIFRISVAGDIRFYGLLKTIGVTPKQLRRIIRHQALMLSAVGVPIGLASGYLVGRIAVPITLMTSAIGKSSMRISLSPWIFIFSAAFSLATVLLSCRRPGRIAGKVAPVEALKYTEAAGKCTKGRKARRVTPQSMAAANLSRSKKKTGTVVVSLALAVVLLNALVTFIGGFDMEKYLKHRSCADFIISTPEYFNYQGNTLTKEDITEIEAEARQTLKGFAYSTPYVGIYMPLEGWLEEAEYYLRDTTVEDALAAQKQKDGKVLTQSQLEGLDPDLIKKLEVIEGTTEPLLEEDSHAIAIEVSLDDYGKIPNPEKYPAVGEKITLTYGNFMEEGTDVYEVEYTVCAWVEIPYNMSSRFYTMGYQAAMGADALIRDAGEDKVHPMLYLFDTPDAAAEEAAEKLISEIASAPGSRLMYESKATQRAHFREFQMTFLILGSLLCAIIGIVGVINFFNASMTSILARRREFAVLQSVGMTGKQLKSMLVAEGLFYTLGSGFVAGLLSAAINPLVGRLLERAYWFYSYRYTIWPVLLLLPIFAILGYAIPTLMYRQASKESIVERLRLGEN